MKATLRFVAQKEAQKLGHDMREFFAGDVSSVSVCRACGGVLIIQDRDFVNQSEEYAMGSAIKNICRG